MNCDWSEKAMADLEAIFEANDRKALKKLFRLIRDIKRNGTNKGLGKPEPLKHELSGFWSREITDEDRLVYYIEGGTLHVVSCKTHYNK